MLKSVTLQWRKLATTKYVNYQIVFFLLLIYKVQVNNITRMDQLLVRLQYNIIYQWLVFNDFFDISFTFPLHCGCARRALPCIKNLPWRKAASAQRRCARLHRARLIRQKQFIFTIFTLFKRSFVIFSVARDAKGNFFKKFNFLKKNKKK